MEKVIAFEKAEKLNPPVERRAKAINTKDWKRDASYLKAAAAAKGIFIDDSRLSDGIHLQLYDKRTGD